MDRLTMPVVANERKSRVISHSLKKLLAQQSIEFKLSTDSASDRSHIETFVGEVFRDRYGAEIQSFLPLLISLSSGQKYRATLGLNPAERGPLFLEQYVDRPIEQIIAQLKRTPTSRQSIVEIGNLASRHQGSTILLFISLLTLIQLTGFRWVVFTATQEVRRCIAKLGLELTPVCPADPNRFGGEPLTWGSYYATQPYVMLGHIDEGYRRCRENPLLDATLQSCDKDIRQLAHQLANHCGRDL